MCQEQEEKLQVLIHHLSTERDVLLQTLRKLPQKVDEYFYQPDSVIATVTPQSHNLELITCILCYVQYGNAMLVLGDRAIPLSQGFTKLDGVGFLLKQNDKRTLTSDSATAGIIYLELFGEEQGDQLVW